ncbi:MAG: hypothetical protein K2X56_26630 [Mycobacterium pseudokansasii]|uniref:YncE family protein n=1 Tax=Mycobacterium pseudokansasii TaxID=2341080 RepID=UPI0007B528F7|nr:hypothetical protein [Mycobacterium pseudokansasii]KZS69071.1 hypothetical protein A4G27_25170 [Mycobacterium kansasii]MBY0391559.1 hypothetical protein [Mycobacterium pseudokansasii]
MRWIRTHSVYVTNYDKDATLWVIDGKAHTVTATVAVGTYPWGVAVDPDIHTVYVMSYLDGTMSVIESR